MIKKLIYLGVVGALGLGIAYNQWSALLGTDDAPATATQSGTLGTSTKSIAGSAEPNSGFTSGTKSIAGSAAPNSGSASPNSGIKTDR